jgi:hypothetical protein
MALISTIKIDRTKAFLKVLSYALSGFSITFIGYILIDTALNYPPKLIGISP